MVTRGTEGTQRSRLDPGPAKLGERATEEERVTGATARQSLRR